MQSILLFWYKESFGRFYSSCVDSINTLEARFAVRDTIRNISKPIFQDYTLQGRFIGVLLRLARIGGGIFFYSLTVVVYVLSYLVWLFFPVLCTASIIGSVIAS